TINRLTEDELVREACFRRDEQLAHEANMLKKIERQAEELIKDKAIIAEKDNTIAEKDSALAQNKATIANLEALVSELQKQLNEASKN
ncbi:MAG: hypothetical protein IJ675_05610, partial [Pseudobutyrivibrio sp.]|nr:hypothetical protein [Pseudobutyrivibrio sp.]